MTGLITIRDAWLSTDGASWLIIITGPLPPRTGNVYRIEAR